MSQFVFLEHEWSGIVEAAAKAESAVHADPRTACFYARRALELAVGWAYKHDPGLKLPYAHLPESLARWLGPCTSGLLQASAPLQVTANPVRSISALSCWAKPPVRWRRR